MLPACFQPGAQYVWSGSLSGRPSYFQRSADLNDPQQFQNNEDDHDDEQDVNDVATTRKAREDIRAEVSEQP
jgi:hypothetical protein